MLLNCFEFPCDALCRNWALVRAAALADLLIQEDLCRAAGVASESTESALSTASLHCAVRQALSGVFALLAVDVFSESSSGVEQRDSEFLMLLIFTRFIDFIQVRS